jgi:type II secretory pathway pseudopilin PulG
LVIALTGILSAIAIPRFVSTTLFTSRTFYDEAVASLRYAQSLAIGSGCEVQVNVINAALVLRMRQNCTVGAFNHLLYSQAIPRSSRVIFSDLPLHFDLSGRCYRVNNTIGVYTLRVDTRVVPIIGQTGYVDDTST